MSNDPPCAIKDLNLNSRKPQIIKDKLIMENKTKDLIKHRYVASDVDHVWTIDFSHLLTAKKNNIWFLCVMDLASRRILSHEIKSDVGHCTWTSEDVIKFVENTLFTYKTKPFIIHTDLGGQFMSKEFKDYLDKAGIKHSLGDQVVAKNPNQVHERFHRTLKNIILRILPQYVNIKKPTLQTLKKVKDFKQVQVIINEAINIYNENEHKHLDGNSPNIVEHALLLKTPTQKGILARNNTTKATEVNNIKQIVLKKYAGNWLDFFIEWRKQAEIDIKNVINTIKKETEMQANRTIDVLHQENLRLGKKMEDLNDQIEVLNQRELAKEAELKFKEERRLARKNRDRLPIRDQATMPELYQAIKIAQKNSNKPYVVSRDIVCLILLYCYGFRAANLRLFTVSHIKQILYNDSLTIPLIKSRNEQVSYAITPPLRALIEQYKEHFLVLIEGKEDSPQIPVITTQNEQKPLSRVSLTNRINNILEKTGKICHKNLKTHSFRIGFITSIIEASSIDEAKHFVKHANISTTNVYNRRNLSEAKAKAILNKVELLRQNKKPKTYTKRKVKKNGSL